MSDDRFHLTAPGAAPAAASDADPQAPGQAAAGPPRHAAAAAGTWAGIWQRGAAPASEALAVYRLRWLSRQAIVALLCGASGSLGMLLPSTSEHVGGFWPAAGVALAAMLRWGSAMALAVAGAALALALALGVPVGAALGIGAGSALGPLMAVRALRRAQIDTRLEQSRDLWLLFGHGALGGGLISAAIGALCLLMAGRIDAVDLPAAALLWWAGDVLGVLLAGVPLIALSAAPLRVPQAPLQAPGWPRLLLVLLGCALTLLLLALMPRAAHTGLALLLLVPPPLLCWLTLRGAMGRQLGGSLAGASSATLAFGLGLMALTALDIGPFAQPQPALPPLWAYLGLLSSLVLLPHALMRELANRDARWQLALDGSDLGVAEWHLASDTHHSTPRWRQQMDDADGSACASLQSWLGRVHADDRAGVLDALSNAPVGSSQALDCRLRVADRWRGFELRLIVGERDEAGAAVRVVATLADNALRRQARDREQLSSSVFLQLHEGLVITDGALRVLDANPTYCRITGIPREELIGTVPGLLNPAHAEGPNRLAQQSLWSALHNGGQWVGELVEHRRNGEACALHVTVSSVYAPDGHLRYHVLVVSDVTEQRLQREQLRRQAHFDELTQLPNRARLSLLLAEAMAATDRDGYLLAVCYLDIDLFKSVNDRHGHEAGDRLLAELANRLRGALRNRGDSWQDAAARLGGDEFVLLLRAGTVDEARAAVERVLRVVSRPYTLSPGEAPQHITASVGATVYPLDASDADTLLRHADHAMYGAKQSGRNGYLFFDPEHSRRHEQRVLAIARVQDALDRRELMLYYQPKVDLRRGQVLGVEALLRWNHPEHGVVPPAQFLPLIEHTGLSARVGDHVLAQALDQLERWRSAGLDLSVSVNITARHLQEPDFAQRLSELLARHAQPLGPQLELEVLETAALTDIGFTSALLERCAKLGVRWALDDFGTGYSTLTYLKRLPVQVLKIDRSFVQNMLTDAQDRAIVEGVISLATTFDCQVVAEGVETPAQARALLELGCGVGQGTGIAAPMPAAEVADWVRNWKGLFALSAATPPAEVAAPAADAAAPPRRQTD